MSTRKSDSKETVFGLTPAGQRCTRQGYNINKEGLLSGRGNCVFTKPLYEAPGPQQVRRDAREGVEGINEREVGWTIKDLLYQIKMVWILVGSYLHFKTTDPLGLGQ